MLNNFMWRDIKVDIDTDNNIRVQATNDQGDEDAEDNGCNLLLHGSISGHSTIDSDDSDSYLNLNNYKQLFG